MSYDLIIRADETYSRSIPHTPLQSFVDQIPNYSQGAFQDDSRDLFMNISLEYIANIEEQDSVSASHSGLVNVIRLHIPYSKLHDDNRDDVYFDMARKIADHVGWSLYDCQTDKYMNIPSDEPTRAPSSAILKYAMWLLIFVTLVIVAYVIR
jgi:hypothetical protein